MRCQNHIFNDNLYCEICEIKKLNELLRQGRDYLMSTPQNEISVEDVLEALGFSRNGLDYL